MKNMNHNKSPTSGTDRAPRGGRGVTVEMESLCPLKGDEKWSLPLRVIEQYMIHTYSSQRQASVNLLAQALDNFLAQALVIFFTKNSKMIHGQTGTIRDQTVPTLTDIHTDIHTNPVVCAPENFKTGKSYQTVTIHTNKGLVVYAPKISKTGKVTRR